MTFDDDMPCLVSAYFWGLNHRRPGDANLSPTMPACHRTPGPEDACTPTPCVSLWTGRFDIKSEMAYVAASREYAEENRRRFAAPGRSQHAD